MRRLQEAQASQAKGAFSYGSSQISASFGDKVALQGFWMAGAARFELRVSLRCLLSML
jgi:hypothetical protein